jgi:hypothetical protein
MEVFFNGYGSWFYEQEIPGHWFPRLYSVTQAGSTFIALPCDDDELRKPFRSIGFFNLTRDDAFAYNIIKDTSLINNLLPPSRDFPPGTLGDLTNRLEIGGLWAKKDNFYFLIDRNQPFILDFDFKDQNQTTPTEKPSPTETNLSPQKEPRIAIHKVIYRAFNSINKPVMDISPDDVMAVIKAEFEQWKESKVTRVFDVKGFITDIVGKEIYWHTPHKDITPLTYANFCRKVKDLKRKACGNG